MTMDIYVGNLPYTATEEQLGELFAPFGSVKRVTIIKDRETGRSKGFGFVVLSDESQVQAAIEAVNGAELGGRVLKANGSEPKPRFEGGGDRPAGGKPPFKSGGGKPFNKGGGGGGKFRESRNDFGDDGYRDKRGGGGGGKSKGGGHRDKHRRPKSDFEDNW